VWQRNPAEGDFKESATEIIPQLYDCKGGKVR